MSFKGKQHHELVNTIAAAQAEIDRLERISDAVVELTKAMSKAHSQYVERIDVEKIVNKIYGVKNP